jgi:hypothetical protein
MADPGAALRRDGWALLEPGWAGEMTRDSWQAFAASWNDLPRDLHMGDRGRYRCRRFATFRIDKGISRLPHAPHYQDLTYNALNGGVPRWYAPIREQVLQSEPFAALVRGFVARVDADGPQLLEAHQFRIEAGTSETGLPTPEGLHRDGRDWVLIAMVGMENAAGGVSHVHDLEGHELIRTRLAAPGEALLLDDHRVQHAVTPVTPAVPGKPARRDVMVLTLAAEA